MELLTTTADYKMASIYTYMLAPTWHVFKKRTTTGHPKIQLSFSKVASLYLQATTNPAHNSRPLGTNQPNIYPMRTETIDNGESMACLSLLWCGYCLLIFQFFLFPSVGDLSPELSKDRDCKKQKANGKKWFTYAKKRDGFRQGCTGFLLCCHVPYAWWCVSRFFNWWHAQGFSVGKLCV